jgi:hypothetical protein
MNQMTMKMASVWLRTAMSMPLLCVAAASGAGAQDLGNAEGNEGLNLGLTAGASWSDNIARTTGGNEEDGTLGRAGVILGYHERRSRVQTDVDANAVYEHYFDDTFDDDVLGGVAGTMVAQVVPERFKWLVQENFGQITTDPFSAETPDNRENINYFSTGPDFTFRLGSAMSLLLSGRYSSTTYEKSDFDGERYGGAVALARQLSGTSSLSLNVTGDRIEFDNSTNNEYDRYQGFVRYNAKGSRTTLAADLGYTAIDNGSSTSNGTLARLSLSRRIAAGSEVRVSAGTQFSDAGDLFRDTQDRQGVQLDAESVISSSDPFESRFVAVGWDFSRNRTSFGVTAQYSEEKYEKVSANDRTVALWSAYMTRDISRALQLRLYGTLEQEEFDTLNFDDDELRLIAALAWSVGRTLEVRLQYERYDRDSSTAASQEEIENRASLFLTWSPIGSR